MHASSALADNFSKLSQVSGTVKPLKTQNSSERHFVRNYLSTVGLPYRRITIRKNKITFLRKAIQSP